MNRSFFRFFAPPIFPDNEEKTRIASILNTILLGTMALLGLFIATQGFINIKSYLSPTTAVMATMMLISVALLWMIRRGYVRTTGFIFVSLGWVLLTFQASTNAGIHDTAFIAQVVIIIVAALLIGVRTSMGFAIISVIESWVFAYLESIGRFEKLGDSTYYNAVAMTVIFLLTTLVSYLAINNLNLSLKKARQSAAALKANNIELQNLQAGLEKRVAERTSELTAALELNQERSNQLKAISDVARRVSMVQDINELLPTVTRLISERFGYYHVGIFLVDEKHEYAVLKAANSEGGQRMLKRGHKLQVGQTGIVGFVTSTGRARVARNVGVDSIYFLNPDLPNTKAEMALPLLIGSQVIGALDIQSEIESAFEEETLDAMRTLADQVAIAIETARLIGETRQALEQSQGIYQQYIQQEWHRLASERREIGYRRDPEGIKPLTEPVNRTEIQAALETGTMSIVQDERSVLAIPIKLRNQVIGVLDISAATPSRRWTSEDLALLQAVADRIALAMENARLIDDTSRRANRERTVSEITTKIRSTTDPQSMLQTALEELKQVLGTDKIQFKPYQQTHRADDPQNADSSTP